MSSSILSRPSGASAPTPPTLNRQTQNRSWHSLSKQQTAEILVSHLKIGLSIEEAKRRQVLFGCNQLATKPRTYPLIQFLRQFNQPLLYILLLAGTIRCCCETG
ncbi:MAG: cation-transporting P-type ATPase [Cyanobacteria bacterium P01_D01_bin.36]